MKKLKNRKTLIASLAIMGALLITTGVSYSLFSYSKNALTENTIESGAIKFHYQEGNRSISINDGMPMTDVQGKAQNNYFDFSITSDTSSEIVIPYTITARRKGNDNSLDSGVKFYLTEVNNGAETELDLETGYKISKFSELTTYTNNALNITAAKNEKTLYVGEVPANSSNYEKNYRLRMWISDDYNITQTITGSCSDDTYTTQEACEQAEEVWTKVATADTKTFTATINVYAEGATAAKNPKVTLVAGDNNVTLVDTTKDLENGSADVNFKIPMGYDGKVTCTNGYGVHYTQGDSTDLTNRIKDRIVTIRDDGNTGESTTCTITTNLVYTVVSGDIRTPGSVVRIGNTNEEFYVLEAQKLGAGVPNCSESSRDCRVAVYLLAKYNLKVGNIFIRQNNNNYSGGQYNSSTQGYGLQDSNMKGWVTGNNVYYNGTVAYASDQNSFMTSCQNHVYGDTISTYLNNYATTLATNLSINNYGTDNYFNSNESMFKAVVPPLASMLSRIGCTTANSSCANQNVPAWIYSTSYWVWDEYFNNSYSCNDGKAYVVWSDGEFSLNNYNNQQTIGVRPLIEIIENPIVES